MFNAPSSSSRAARRRSAASMSTLNTTPRTAIDATMVGVSAVTALLSDRCGATKKWLMSDPSTQPGTTALAYGRISSEVREDRAGFPAQKSMVSSGRGTGPEQGHDLGALAARKEELRRIAALANDRLSVETRVPREQDQLVGLFALREVHGGHAQPYRDCSVSRVTNEQLETC
jgi:hypothetical protein